MILVGQRSWLVRDDFIASYVETIPAFADATIMAVIGWDADIAAIDTGGLVCSSSGAQILRITASLAGSKPIDLSDVLTGLDGTTPPSPTPQAQSPPKGPRQVTEELNLML